MMRIGVLGPAPFVGSGYGVQVANLLRILRAQGHEAACFALAGLEHGAIEWEGHVVYPKLFHEMGQDLACHARHFRADVVIAVMDAWLLELDAWEGVQLIPWFPVDHAPLSPHIAARLARLRHAAVYSRFGQRECERAGYVADYIPCMVDCEMFHPIDRSEARAALGWPQDRYIVGMVVANAGAPSRKAFYQQLRAFKLFQGQHPDALLYLHTFANAGGEIAGEHLIEMCKHLGLVVDQDVMFVDQYHYLLGLPPAHLALCYNAMDVLMGVSTGEGFNVPLIEAQACGTPVITGDWTSMSELCFAGWLVPRATAEVYGTLMTDDDAWGQLAGCKVVPRTSAIVESLETAYQERSDPFLRGRARTYAMDFDVRRVANDYWRSFLVEIAS